MNPNAELKKNLVLSVVLHAAVLAFIILFTAFAPQPRIDTTIEMSIGGPGAGGGGEEQPPPPPPPAAKEETPPKQEEQQKIEPARIVPKQEDMVVPRVEKKKVEKKPEPRKEEVKKPEPKKEEVKKPETKKTEDKPKLISRKDFEKKNASTKTTAKLDPRYSADAIRSRLGKAVNSVKVGPAGAGPGTNAGPGGGGSQFGEYYSMLSSILYEAWDTPGTATPSMSTVVQVRISSDGTLTFLKIVRKSGSDIMDESVISAVVKTKKVPPPPAGMGNAPEISITFQPEGA